MQLCRVGFFSIFFISCFHSSRALSDEALLPRTEIFSPPPFSRPVISSSGTWLIDTDLNKWTSLRLTAIDKHVPDRTLDLEGVSQIYWYRWSREDKDILILSCKRKGIDTILLLDPTTGILTSLTSSDDKTAGTFATYVNNYAFALQRYKNTVTGIISYLAPDGKLIASKGPKNLIPDYLKPDDGFLWVGFKDGKLNWEIGKAESTKSLLAFTIVDQRRGSQLVALSSNEKAYFLSTATTDRLSLLSYELSTGKINNIVQEEADINRVILNPIDNEPDVIEFERVVPKLKALNTQIQSDIAFLSSLGWGVPRIIDRSPNDQFWVLHFQNKDGTPIWILYNKKSKSVQNLSDAPRYRSNNEEWRVKEFTIDRPNKPLISGYVSMPAKSRCEDIKCPAVLLLHGGPAERDYFAFNPERFWLTSRGIMVISVNYRGSSGFGKEYESLDAKEWSKGIPEDIADAMKYVIPKFEIDPKRIAIVGTSFSGYLALNLLKTPSFFKCAIVDSAPTDLVRFAEARFASYGEDSDLLFRIGDTRVPAEKKEMSLMSPTAHLAELKSKSILQFHGAKDSIVGFDTLQEFSEQLLKMSARYTFAYLPNEGHGLVSARKEYHAISEQFLSSCLDVKGEPISSEENNSVKAVWLYGDKSFMQSNEH